MALKTYNPKEVIVTFKGIIITGFMDGTFIEVERSADSFTKKVGSDGQVARTQNQDFSGKITFTTMAVAPINDFLDALMDVDEATGLNFGAFQVKDNRGTMNCSSHEAWFMKRPKVDRAKETGGVQWVMECSDIDIHAGSNVI